MDGVDAALVDCQKGIPRLIHARSYPYPKPLAVELTRLNRENATLPLASFGSLDARVAEHFADSALKLIHDTDYSIEAVTAIGSHGQTIFHSPSTQPAFTLQIGDPNRIAELTACQVIADFRRRDIAAGGQGAPLASLLHASVFQSSSENRAVLNLGGIANLTLLPADLNIPIIGFDTGPANCLMDAWMSDIRSETYDRNGQWAKQGQSQADLLSQMLNYGYFSKAPPKSTGREEFNLDWLRKYPIDTVKAVDIQATLLELSAQSIAQAIHSQTHAVGKILICGGGVHNKAFIKRLQTVCPNQTMSSVDDYGLAADWLEAILFAWLAYRRLNQQCGNLPSVTGASGPRVLGGIY